MFTTIRLLKLSEGSDGPTTPGATVTVPSARGNGKRGDAVVRRFECLRRRHDWHSTYDRETEMTWWDCRNCSATKRGSGTDATVNAMFWALG